MNTTEAFDLTIFDVMYEDEDWKEDIEENEKNVKSAYEALVMSVNRNGAGGKVDLAYMSKVSGLSMDALILKLHGTAIIQDPDVFADKDAWDRTKGWVLLPQYVCGNIVQKLKKVRSANKRYPGCFEKNEAILREKMPAKLTLEDIHVGLGAAWVPVYIYEQFFKELFAFVQAPKIEYISELAVWKITPPDEAKYSVINNYTYGTSRMSGIKIAEKTMNAGTVKVYDEVQSEKSIYLFDRVLNEAETLAAQEKQNLILSQFNDWIYDDKARKRILEECYNDTFVGYTQCVYNGDFLELRDLNPGVELYQHQKNAIARVVLSDKNVLLAHDVGAGKTYEMIVSVHELKRLGLSKKNMIVVPNNIFSATVDAHKYLYPEDKIFAVYPKDFSREKRNRVLARIKEEDFTAVYIAYSSFDMITMSKSYWIDKQAQDIRKLRSAAYAKSDAYRKKRLEREADRLAKKLQDYMSNEIESPWINFDELGIETLIVDEAHNYKNIPFKSSADNVVGMHTQGSKKCKEMLEKVHSVKRCIFSTGTPLTNSLADLYAIQMYLQPETLSFRDIDSFDMWMHTFAERETHYEIKPDSSDIRLVTRFSKFHNLTELMGIFSCICDFYYVDEKAENGPAFEGYTDVQVPKTAAQAQYIKELAERSEKIHFHVVDRTEDNPLKVTTDGRKCALDTRLLGIEDPEYRKGKISACADIVTKLYHKHPGTCQVVFSDIGVPKDGFNVYDELRKELEERNIPSKEIAYIHEATGEKAKTNLFKSVNEGITRVVIGSTSKLGIGVNIQEKLVALHHLSVPWRPSDMVQREGRILRRGNTCEEVYIYHYVTEGTFDSYSWQLLENKQRFISSFLSGVAVERDVDDIQDMILSYAEVKALAIGNGLIRNRVETANRLERVKMAGRQRQKQLTDLRGVISAVPAEIKELEYKISVAKKDKEYYEKHKEKIPNSERRAFGAELQCALEENHLKKEERFFDYYQGYRVCLPANMFPEKSYVIICRENYGRYSIQMNCDKIMGYSKRIDYFLDHFDDYINNLSARISSALKRKAEAEEDFNKGNMYSEQIKAIEQELKRIDEEIYKIREEKNNEN